MNDDNPTLLFVFAELLQGHQSGRNVHQVFALYVRFVKVFCKCCVSVLGSVCTHGKACLDQCSSLCVCVHAGFHNLTRDYKSSTELMSKSTGSAGGLTAERTERHMKGCRGGRWSRMFAGGSLKYSGNKEQRCCLVLRFISGCDSYLLVIHIQWLTC